MKAPYMAPYGEALMRYVAFAKRELNQEKAKKAVNPTPSLTLTLSLTLSLTLTLTLTLTPSSNPQSPTPNPNRDP